MKRARKLRGAARSLAAGVAALAAIAGIAAIGWRFLREDEAARHLEREFTRRAAAATDRNDPDPAQTPESAIAAAREDEGVEASIELLVDSASRVGPMLVVVDRLTGAPLPDASVTLVPREGLTEEEWDGLGAHDPAFEPRIEATGQPIALDALASAALPWSEGEALLVAASGEKHGRVQLTLALPDRHLLRLVRREALTLRAADPDGYPQKDVPVSLQSLRLGGRRNREATLLWAQPTDRAGEATIAHGSELLDERVDPDGMATWSAVVAALAFPCRDPSPVLVDPRLGCARPTELVTPPRATLRLRAEGSDPGKPFPDVVQVNAQFSGKWAPSLSVKRSWPATIPPGGCAELVVEAGIAVKLDAWALDGRFESEPTTVQTPGRAESLDVVLLLREQEKPPECTVRVVGPDGRPLASTAIAWQLQSYAPINNGGGDAFDLAQLAPRADALVRAITDGEGRASLPTGTLASFVTKVAEAAAEKRRRGPRRTLAFLELFAELDAPLPTGARLAGALALPPLQPADATDLGTLTLSEVPVLCGGRVVDPAGTGIEKVSLHVKDTRDTEDSKKWLAVTDRSGRWLVHANASTPSVEVWPERDGWWREGEYLPDGTGDPLRVPVGTDGVAVTLHRVGTTRGRLLVEPGVSIHELQLDVEGEATQRVRCRLDADGRFRIAGPPGRRSLVVASNLGFGDPIARVDGFLLVEAEETEDPRLDPIDLRRMLRQVELDVRAADGSPVADAWLFLTRNRRVPDAPRGLALVRVDRATDPFGRAVVTTPAFDAWLVVGSPNHVFQDVGFERAFREVRLAAPVAVRVAVEGPAEKLLARKDFCATLTLDDASGGEAYAEIWRRLPKRASRRLDDRSVELAAVIAGDYSLFWKSSPERRDREALRGPLSFDLDARRAGVDLVERFTLDDVARIQSRLGR